MHIAACVGNIVSRYVITCPCRALGADDTTYRFFSKYERNEGKTMHSNQG